MPNIPDAKMIAGEKLRLLIKTYYKSQEEFAYEYGADIRTINRYINEGIKKVDTIQELAAFFDIEFMEFFKLD